MATHKILTDVHAPSIGSDGVAKSYTWTLPNTSSNNQHWYKIARVTGSQSQRFKLQMVGGYSYSDNHFASEVNVYGQLNNDNNYDLVFYQLEKSGQTSSPVLGFGQVDVDGVSTDLYVKLSNFAELAITASVSKGDIYPEATSTSSASEPTNFVAATEQFSVLSEAHFAGEVNAASLDISGDADIDGTLNADGLDVDGNADISGVLTTAGGIAHTGDTDTLLEFTGANELKIKAGGATHFHAGSDQTTHLYSGNALTLSCDTSQNATFTGELTVGSHVNMGDGDRVKLGASSDLQIVHNGSASYIHNVNDTSGHLYLKQSSNNNDIIFIGKDNGTEFTALTLDMSDAGKATFNNDVVAFSDKKLKENIETLDGKKVLDMRGVSFTRKDTGLPSSGVIAQEIQEVAPELVSETNGTLGVSYGNLVGYLIEAVKDQQKQIDELKAIINGSSK